MTYIHICVYINNNKKLYDLKKNLKESSEYEKILMLKDQWDKYCENVKKAILAKTNTGSMQSPLKF